MAPINQINTGGEQVIEFNILSTWLATICLLIGMIISLVGIKIWWFKHRLTFEQSATHNGAAGGSQPILRNPTKDKRSSQQVSESVVVHGVFRKRQEDELEIVDRPKQLPPIRIPERSQSSSALMPPPRLRRELLTPDITTTTTRMLEPPPAPLRTFQESLEPQFEQNEIYNQTQAETIQSAPNSPNLTKNLSNHNHEWENKETSEAETLENSAPERLFRKVTVPKDKKPLESQGSERRATGFMRPEETQQLEEWLVNKVEIPVEPTSSLNNEIPQQQQPFKNLNETVRTSWHIEKIERDTLDGVVVKEERQILEKDWLDSYDKTQNDNEDIWQEMGVAVDSKDLTQHIEQQFEKIRHSFLEDEGHFLELNNIPNNNNNKSEFKITEVENEPKTLPTSTGFEEDWQPQHFEVVEPTYAVIRKSEIENSNGFGITIDEDWENFQKLQAEKDKEIEDEWSKITNFPNTPNTEETLKQFQNEKENQITNFQEQQLLSSATAYVESIEELYDELSDNEYNKTENFQEIPLSPAAKTSILKEHIQIFENSDYQGPTAATRKLKSQQKVTFDVNTEEYYLPESESEIESEQYEDENENEDEFKKTYFGRKFEDEDDEYDFDDDEYKPMPQMPPPPLPRTQPPTPMQRLTKIQNSNEAEAEPEEDFLNTNWTQTQSEKRTIFTNQNEEVRNFEQEMQQMQQQQTAALLFSTQIAFDEHTSGDHFITENNSWTAIRQRRYQNEEFQQEFIQHDTEIQFKPQASPRLGQREMRAPAPRSIRKSSFEE